MTMTTKARQSYRPYRPPQQLLLVVLKILHQRQTTLKRSRPHQSCKELCHRCRRKLLAVVVEDVHVRIRRLCNQYETFANLRGMTW